MLALLLTVSAGILQTAQPPVPAQAPPPVTERVVVTATASPSLELALGRTITVLTREDIERFAGGSLADALRLVPGVDVRARGERGVQADFMLRGANFGQTLVLVEGLRLNDAQSGHHNADFPVPASAIDRIEVATGAASSAHGADALGGAIQIITRAGAYREATAAAGSFGAVRGEAAAGWAPKAVSASLWGARSGGFMFDRDFAMGGARVALDPFGGLRLSLAHARKAFGANGFYGPSPSKEWTDLTLLTASAGRSARSWHVDMRGAYRHHGDHFRWDIARPGFAENRHQTDAFEASLRADRTLRAARLSVGASAGTDRITSSNLGAHTESRGAGFSEAQLPLGSKAMLQPAVRIDSYATFGTAVSPSLAASIWTDGGWRVRGSAGRAFRVPTFTERYYSDPNHAARAALTPERGWSADAGVDWRRGGWSASATAFSRWDSDVIDWVRPSSAVRWQTTNVHQVDTRGLETRAERRMVSGFARVTYAWIDSSAPSLALLSKYVLDYTRHAIGAQLALPLPGRVDLSLHVNRRLRSDRQRYTLVDARAGRRIGIATVFVEGSNLLDEEYREIAGVQMPGRSAMAGLTLR